MSLNSLLLRTADCLTVRTSAFVHNVVTLSFEIYLQKDPDKYSERISSRLS